MRLRSIADRVVALIADNAWTDKSRWVAFRSYSTDAGGALHPENGMVADYMRLATGRQPLFLAEALVRNQFVCYREIIADVCARKNLIQEATRKEAGPRFWSLPPVDRIISLPGFVGTFHLLYGALPVPAMVSPTERRSDNFLLSLFYNCHFLPRRGELQPVNQH